jgi:hypothetical protein
VDREKAQFTRREDLAAVRRSARDDQRRTGLDVDLLVAESLGAGAGHDVLDLGRG